LIHLSIGPSPHCSSVDSIGGVPPPPLFPAFAALHRRPTLARPDRFLEGPPQMSVHPLKYTLSQFLICGKRSCTARYRQCTLTSLSGVCTVSRAVPRLADCSS
jgi:hypothetical protein